MDARPLAWLGTSLVLALLVAGGSRGGAAETIRASDAKKPAPAPAKDAAGKPVEATFDTLKLEMKKGDPFKKSLLTDKVKKIDGKTIRIRGYILPSFQQNGITDFVLVRDNMECCFGPGAALYDCIRVVMKEGTSTDYSVRPVTVEGVFSVRELTGPDGQHLAIYHIDGTSVK